MQDFINIIKKYEDIISRQPKWDNDENLAANDKQKIKRLKNEIREFLRKKQSYNNGILCVYCKTNIEEYDKNIIDEHIEHILCKEKYKELTFAPYNLALACSACNYNKGKKDIIGNVHLSGRDFNFNNLINKSFLENKYTEGIHNNNQKVNYNIIHPYYDKYDENIEILNDCAYNIRPNAPNYMGAKNMIKICGLMETAAIEKRKQDTVVKKVIECINKLERENPNASLADVKSKIKEEFKFFD